MERRIWYDRPASAWEEALPLGNGRLGLMVYGGIGAEFIQLSEKTMWSGYPADNENPECLPHLAEMRELLFSGKLKEAEELCRKYLICRPGTLHPVAGIPHSYGYFETAGTLEMQMQGTPIVNTDGYYREVDLFDGVATVSFEKVLRRHLVSEEYEVTAHDIVSKAVQSYRFRFSRPDCTVVYDNTRKEIIARGRFEGGGASSWCTVISFVTDGGQVDATRDSESQVILMHNIPSRVTFYTATATSYRTDKDPEQECRERIDAARAAGFEKIYEEHVAHHRTVMERTSLNLGGEAHDDIPTDKRLERIVDGKEDIAFNELYFNYGKYLFMSCARGILPANLQGIWVKDTRPPWYADFHTNINLQMAYWHANVLGMSEYNESLFRFMEILAKAGEKSARDQYGCRGWVAHVMTNPWGFTALGTDPRWGAFTTSGAWLCRHIYEHYSYTGDLALLRRYYPVMHNCALFYLDFLVRDPNTGYLVIAPSNSPENHYKDPSTGETVAMTYGTTMDNSILREFFTIMEKCGPLCDEAPDFIAKIVAARDQLPPIRIGKHGQIMEWIEDYEETELGHRHISNLYGLYPAGEISWETPELLDGARMTIKRRIDNGGGGSIGWSCGWLLCFFARLLEGDKAAEMLTGLYQHGTFRNLFDHHPPYFFQMDGNHGATAGIAELLLQSHTSCIDVLPALPSAWKDGSYRGLRARGGLSVDCTWKDGKATSVRVQSLLGNPLRIRVGEHTLTCETEKGEWYTVL